MDAMDTDFVESNLWEIAYMAGFREGQISKDAYGNYPAGNKTFCDLVKLICSSSTATYSEIQGVLAGEQ